MSDANAEQRRYWNEQAGPKWVALQAHLDGMLRAVGLRAIEGLGSIDGASVLDVGCGCGGTSLELARRVGASGNVVGVDVSEPMLSRARQSASEQGVTNVDFRLGDAQSERFDETFDAIFSRFGVMFFADPRAAFANLRDALKRSGALSFACWRAMNENEWMMVPVMAALQHVPPPEMPPAGAPGPFAFAERDRVAQILDGAGFTAVEIEPFDTTIDIGGGRPLEEVAEFTVQMGPTARILQDAPADLKTKVAASITDALRPYYTDGSVALQGAGWLVRARNVA